MWSLLLHPKLLQDRDNSKRMKYSIVLCHSQYSISMLLSRCQKIPTKTVCSQAKVITKTNHHRSLSTIQGFVQVNELLQPNGRKLTPLEILKTYKNVNCECLIILYLSNYILSLSALPSRTFCDKNVLDVYYLLATEHWKCCFDKWTEFEIISKFY